MIRKRTFPKEFELKKEAVFYPSTTTGCLAPYGSDADILEIGPGNGDFLVALAGANPAKKIIAVEIREKRFRKISKRLEKGGLKNVLLLWGDARVMIPRHFKEVSLEKIYILFPDPWPKRRHTFHRLLDEDFLAFLSERLQKKGHIILATDSKEYGESIAEMAKKTKSLKKTPFERDFQETFFERVWKKEGKSIHYFCFSKV